LVAGSERDVNAATAMAAQTIASTAPTTSVTLRRFIPDILRVMTANGGNRHTRRSRFAAPMQHLQPE
jgi:hypothetical protein